MSHEADYIVIGAGSAGCAVAARLSERKTARVLLLEAGGGNRRLEVKVPAAFSQQFHGKLDWDYWTDPEPHLNGRRLFSPRGKMVGGSSEMNAMIYLRGNRLDYDSWSENGATGWSYADVLPIFKRFESNDEFGGTYHGTTGALKVTRIPDPDPVSLALVEAAAALGIERNNDFNGETQDGTGRVQVTQHRGMRFGSAEAYLAPIARRRNLEVRSDTLVTRIIVERGRAVAVETSDRNGNTERINARAEIIVSGGAFNTPALLQHSGIGPADFLRSVGVKPVVDLPAVGENLMEHPLVYTTYELTGGHIGIADATKPKYLLEWLLRRRGKLTSNVAETAAHVRTDAAMPAPNFQCLFAPGYFYDHGQMAWDVPAATIAMSYIAPRSRGTVRIRSNDPTRKPRVAYNMLSTRAEMDEMIDAVDLARDIAATGPARAVLGTEITPGRDVRTRDEVEAWIRTSVQHTYHPACTARIGTPDDGVVDPQLRVHGVEGLRVADTSVMPTIIRGNTNAPAIMIGERCADFLGTTVATSASGATAAGSGAAR
ncbi:GMC family oxidoreductase [Rhodococcus sp. NPDC056960]|uniref:GMC family oxidoreductase n=1 Tax=Rhodococcus sp. NPDC056960 TaxID=3345982 RepID=UPI003633A2DC